MTLDTALDALYATSLAVLMRENDVAFPWVESVHVLAVALVVGSIAIVDLRLLGLASRDRAVGLLSADVLPVTWGAFALAVATGAMMFASNAPRYADNRYLRVKFVLLALAGLNMLLFQRFARRRVGGWGAGVAAPPVARVAAACSLLLWALVVTAGRWVGFTMLAGY